MTEAKEIAVVIREHLAKDLGAELTNGHSSFRCGDVAVNVWADFYFHTKIPETYKIKVAQAGYIADVRPSSFKAVRVNPDQTDSYLKNSYPAVLEKVRKAVDKIQARIDETNAAQRRRLETEQRQARSRAEFATTNDLSSFLDAPDWSDESKYWKSKDEKLDFELRPDGTFDLDKCRVRLSLEQVKKIIEIVTEASL